LNTFVAANPNKCIGCKSCEIACAAAHLGSSLAMAGSIDAPFSPRINLVRAESATLPVQCRQCEDAPCANVCPVGAIVHQEDKVIVKTELCIGCGTCMIACPFGVMDMVPQCQNGEMKMQAGLSEITAEGMQSKEVMVAHKCDLCVGRPGGPACIEVCPNDVFTLFTSEFINDSIVNKRQSSLNSLKLT
jgi:electron transport protein HydN